MYLLDGVSCHSKRSLIFVWVSASHHALFLIVLKVDWTFWHDLIIVLCFLFLVVGQVGGEAVVVGASLLSITATTIIILIRVWRSTRSIIWRFLIFAFNVHPLSMQKPLFPIHWLSTPVNWVRLSWQHGSVTTANCKRWGDLVMSFFVWYSVWLSATLVALNHWRDSAALECWWNSISTWIVKITLSDIHSFKWKVLIAVIYFLRQVSNLHATASPTEVVLTPSRVDWASWSISALILRIGQYSKHMPTILVQIIWVCSNSLRLILILNGFTTLSKLLVNLYLGYSIRLTSWQA